MFPKPLVTAKKVLEMFPKGFGDSPKVLTKPPDSGQNRSKMGENRIFCLARRLCGRGQGIGGLVLTGINLANFTPYPQRLGSKPAGRA